MPIHSLPVPVEIVELIIDELHDDTYTLKHCALVARAFRRCSQKHLYRYLAIKFSNHPTPDHEARGLLDALTEHPHLARSVRHLRIWNYLEGFFDPGAKRWVQITDDILIRIFQKLPSLCFLAFSASQMMYDFSVHPPQISWSHLSPPLVLALTTMLRSSPITSIIIQGFTHLPITDIAINSLHLERLSLSYTDTPLTWDDDDDSWLIPDLEIPIPLEATASNTTGDKNFLESLTMDDYSVLTVHELCRSAVLPHSKLSLLHLREVVVHNSTRYMADLPDRIMEIASGSLETLCWKCPDYTWYTERHVEIDAPAIPPEIRSLRLLFDHFHGVTPHHMSYVCEALEEIAGGNKLEEILLVLGMEAPSDQNDVWCESVDWTAWFDELLTGVNEFPHMRRVTIFIQHPSLCEHSQCVPVARYDEINRRLERMLCLLHARGTLSVQWMVAAVEESMDRMGVATRALSQKIEGGVFVGPDGRLKRC
ncbi:hypothetical protein Hypma_005652 [Hypsizygus marmoreus]|uniref:F-box domain-containing protein n=1 Tax=Hypsizygus marmoreus TaxID=39966 RepID=A0A369K1E6_HYPMA|nr:hypothetical protein Hypma_005652 [Hypsizygus marmoreus]